MEKLIKKTKQPTHVDKLFPKEENMLVRLWRVLAPFHRDFRWFLILITIYEGLRVVEGYLNSFVIKLFNDQAPTVVWVVLALCLAVYDELFMRLDNRVDWHILSRQGFPIFKFLKMEAINKFLKLDVAWHQKNNSGALVGKVANGAAKVNEIIDLLSWETVSTLIQALLSFGALWFFSIGTIPLAIIAFGLFLVLTWRSIKEKEPFRVARYDGYESESERFVETVQNVEAILMFGQTKRMGTEMEEVHDTIMTSGLDEFHVGVFKYNRWRIRLLTVARRACLFLWVSQLQSGSLDVANFIFVSSLTEKLFSSFWRFARIFDRITEASEAAKRLTNVYAEQTKDRTEGKDPAISGPVGISMQNVCFSYDENYSAEEGTLHDFSLEVTPGQIVAFVGPSGGGKTTIRRLITGLYPLQSGSISVNGLDIREWSMEALLRLFSYVPQGDDVAIFARSIKDNIRFAKPDATLKEVVYAAEMACIDDFIQTLPEKYDTMLGERGKRLSGGQKQRVALARAILANRPILFLDEATSALDSLKEKEFQDKLKVVMRNKTVFIIAHRLSTVWDIADKIVVIDQGRIVEEGTHQELVQKGGLYAKMAALQTT